MMKIGFLEISPIFSNQIKIPYSTGVIWSHCITNDKIKKEISFNMDHWIYTFDKSPEDISENLKCCNVICASNFVWNQNINRKICELVKKKNENCLIIYGGLGTPNADRCKSFLENNPFIDILVHGEGEFTLEEILLSIIDKKDFRCINGITTKTFSTQPRTRVKNIDNMPSPYLNGLFDELIRSKTHSYEFEALVEPVRGCPYSCSFCEIGDRYFTKLSKQSNNKIFKEIDWVSKNNIEYLHIIDNNFGMFPDHYDITNHIIDANKKNNFPKALNITWAKNKKKLLFDIAADLQKAGMQKGVTIALQSMNHDTLRAIKRSNIDLKNLKELIDKFETMGIPTYIEIILGLPEETYNSFKNGIFELLDDLNYKSYVGIYAMSALPNTDFYDKNYIKKYDLKFADTCPAFYHHDNDRELLKSETERMVVGSKTLSFDEYLDILLFRWFIMTFHFLGWTRIISFDLKKHYNISIRDFYESLFTYINNYDGLLNTELNITKKMLFDVFDKKEPWGRKVEDVSNIYWEYEEATSIVIAKNKLKFYDEISSFLRSNNLYNGNMLEKQIHKMKDPYIHYNADIEKWAKECLWWGRRNETYFIKDSV